jgi:CheY-like chemotaxis protein
MEAGPYVLVVDDDADARELLARVVSAVGLTPRPAGDGLEALRLIRLQHPTLILLDLMMPCMDGFRVLAYLRARPETRRLPVIVVSACVPGQAALLQLPGVIAVLCKDYFLHSTLISLVQQTLGLPVPGLNLSPSTSNKQNHLHSHR